MLHELLPAAIAAAVFHGVKAAVAVRRSASAAAVLCIGRSMMIYSRDPGVADARPVVPFGFEAPGLVI